MKEILIVVPDDKLGGSEQLLKNITLLHLQNKDFVNVIFYKKSISSQWEDLKTFPNIELSYTASNNDLRGMPFAIYNLYKIRRVFDRIYTSHLHTTSFIGILIKLKIVRKRVFVGRESLSFFLRYKGNQLRIFKFLYRVGYSPLDLLICQTDLMKDQLLEGLPGLMKKINIQVIPNPINIQAIQRFPTDYVKEFDENFIVSAGRLIWDKGYDILIEAYHKLKNEFPHLKLIILGEGPLRKDLEEQIASLNLTSEILLKGHVSNVYKYFKNAEMCVVSSRIEGFPNVLLQMMSKNNRVVSTKCAGGITDLTGIVCADTFSVQDLYQKMKDALNTEDLDSNIFQNQLAERNLENFLSKIDNGLKPIN